MAPPDTSVASAPPAICPTTSGARPRTGPASRPSRPLHRYVRSLSPGGWACADALVIGSTALLAQAMLVSTSDSFGWIANPWLSAAAFSVCLTVAGLVFGLYERKTLLSRSAILCRTVLTLGLGVTLAFAIISVFFYAAASRWVGLAVAAAYLAFAIPLRLLAHEVITAGRVRVLLVGDGESLRKVAEVLQRPTHRNYELVGHLRVPHGARGVANPPRGGFRTADEQQFAAMCPALGTLQAVTEVVAQHPVDEIIIGAELTGDDAVARAVAPCLESRCRVTDQPTFVEKLLGEVPADAIRAEWFIQADVQNHGSYEFMKDVMDVAFGAVGLVLSAPLWPLIALAIKLDSRGPVFYRQMRVGRYGRCFNIYKFRTMRADAEREGARWAAPNDDRTTRLGRFLRRSRLDELPQLLNIVRGDMSLVGPRPERPEFVHNLEQLLPHYRLRHLVKPGLTGWAQIHYGYAGSVADTYRKLCFDLYYLKHRSLDLDAGILIRTCGTFLLGGR